MYNDFSGSESASKQPKSNGSAVDSSKQVTFGAWSPATNDRPGYRTLALTYRNCIYLYESKNSSGITNDSSSKLAKII